MSILSRLITVVRATMNALLNKAEDPTAIIEQSLLDMDASYRKAKDQYEGTQTAKYALETARQLLRDGKIGWDRNCQSCRLGRGPACDEHRESPEL